MEQCNRKEWLGSLKEGDKVAYDEGKFIHGIWRIEKIIRITPTRKFTLSSGKKFDKRGIIGGEWCFTEMVPVTKEIIENIEGRNILNKVLAVDLKSLSTYQLKKIMEIIKDDTN